MVSTGPTKQVHNPSDPPGLSFEQTFWQAGILRLAGLDEAGRGAWAGPVAAAAVILPHDQPDLRDRMAGVRDSKQMTARQRTLWAERIRGISIACGVGLASNAEIDEIGILRATRLAMHRALAALTEEPQHLLVDALLLREVDFNQSAIIKGDCLSLSIAAASILAKTARDSIMVEMDDLYPGYGFRRHKGYGTAVHRQALGEKGPCAIHRHTFRPVFESLC